MNVSIINKNEYLKEASIVVEKEIVEKKIDEILEFYKDKIAIPGFRIGKAPKEIIYKKLKKGIDELVIEKLINEYYENLIKEKDWQVVGEVKITEYELTPEKELKFTILLEIIPDFPLKEYKEIPIKKFEITGFDEEFEKRVRALQEKCATYTELDRPAKEGDFLLIDYSLLDENNNLLEKRENLLIKIGDEKNHPELNKNLIGVEAGKEVLIRINNNQYKIFIRSVREQHLPEINEEFAKALGFESLKALKEEIENEINEEREKLLEENNKKEVINYLLNNYEFQPPPSLVKEKFQFFLNNLNKKEEDLTEELKKRLLEEAEKQAKLSCLLLKIAKKENIEVNEEELEESLNQFENIEENEISLLKKSNLLKRMILEEKVLKFLVEKAKIIED
ncbi:MAG: trigger factor [candidate division WOR-3 bacterium]|nr:trigger factor [candidate division WOR-3 bacterium]MCX7836696.1 trigger factor [candidate division WOR-3 bacterium]MDW8113467.1 trigger factor [candidate division WOR-3 bacterium]